MAISGDISVSFVMTCRNEPAQAGQFVLCVVVIRYGIRELAVALAFSVKSRFIKFFSAFIVR